MPKPSAALSDACVMRCARSLFGRVGLVAVIWGFSLHAAHAQDAASAARSLAALSPSFQKLLSSSPPSASPWAKTLVQALEAYTSAQEAQRALKQLRLDQDSAKTELIAVSGTLDLLTKQRQELEKQLKALENQRQQRLEAMRKQLETRLQGELSQVRQQIGQDLEKDFAREVQAFEARQGNLLDESAAHEIELQEREIQQLSHELETLTAELRDRLARLQPGSDFAQSLDASISRTIAQHKADLQTRRDQLKAQREQLIAKRKAEFIEKLKQQQALESQTRLLYKEASLRQAMAELLQQAQVQEEGSLRQTKQELEELKPRQLQAAKRQALLVTKSQDLDQQIAEVSQRIQTHEAVRGDSLVRLEETFQKGAPGVHVEGLTWFHQVLQQAPPDLATELGVIYQRLAAKAEQERQAQEQQRMMRERELAMQVSREMERRYQEAQEARRREDEERTRRTEGLFAKSRELQQSGKLDEALRVVGQIQAIDPSKSSHVAVIQQEIAVAKEQARRQAQSATVERLFTQAMKAFDQGHYEEAVGLFEQVISQEAQAGKPAK